MTGLPRSPEASVVQRTGVSTNLPRVAGGPSDPTQTANSTAQAATGPVIEGPAAPLQVRARARYEVIGEHGRGGLGRVSRARDTELGRDVAIKELIQRSDLGEVRFLREALITARLEHPGIVPIHEAGRWDDGTPFYAMKLVSGRPLKELMATRTTLEQRLELLNHVIAVADAIAYAHGRRIIHRDLKPGNVIVGDFGETIVIDWGLAKDLSSTEDVPATDGLYRMSPSDDLTAAGSVVGTPAYMAPEQARGEPVDERVDVFAIGAMLWELCARTRAPPNNPRQRERLLRRAGIDTDLATIVGKALAQDPQDRYRDAALLAADLKAFQAGARIAARSYSLLEMLAHWMRRHCGLSVLVPSAVVVAIAGIIAFVHNIAVQRDRADAAAIEARAQQQRAELAKDELTLQHAELQLRTDPTATMSTLATYHGTDTSQLRRLRAEAAGRGVATAVLRPHGEQIRFLAGNASGAIISLADDHTVRVTRGSESTTLASNVSTRAILTHSAAAQLMAYSTAPSGIAVLALSTYAFTTIHTSTPVVMDIAPDGSRLAAVAPDGTITIWTLAPSVAVEHEEQSSGVIDLEFISPTRLVVQQRGGLRTIELSSQHAAYTISLASVAFDVDSEHVAIADDHGNIALLSPELALLSRVTACHKNVTAVSLVSHTDLVTFACEEGIAGVARYEPSGAHLSVVDTFPTVERPWRARADPMGRHIVVSDDSSFVYVYDVETKIVKRYEGQAALVSFVAPATPDFDHILVGDIHGNVRVWDPPSRDARKLLQAPSAVFAVAFAPDGKSVVTNPTDGIVRRVRVGDGAVTEFRGHTGVDPRVSFSPDGQSVLSFSSDGTARIWRASDGIATRVFAEHASAVEGARYIESGHRVVSIGDDGRLLAWSPDDAAVSVLFTRPLPLTALEVLSRNDHIVVQDAAGSIWDVAPSGAVRQARNGDGASVTVLRASPDGRLVATGTDKGAVVVYDTTNWTIIKTTKVDGGVRQLRFDPRNRELIIISEDQRVRVVALSTARTLPWRDIPMAARNIAYGLDGETLAFVCADGGTWLYDIHNDLWAYALDHSSDTFSGVFSPDGTLFASSDRRGAVTIRDVAATFTAATRQR